MKYQIEIKGVIAICITALLLIIIGVGLLYWFQIRPSRIYSVCNSQALKQALEEAKKRTDNPGEGWYKQSDYDFLYKQCLREKGFNK